MRGEEVVRLIMKNGVGLMFHPECYLKWNEAKFMERLLNWRLSITPRPKLGRPRVACTDRKKRRRLLSLLCYHRKLGNETRVGEIQIQIDSLLKV